MAALMRLKYRNIETKEQSPQIYKVIEDHVTLNPRHEIKQYFVGDPSTIFNEVEIMPYQEACKELFEASKTTGKRAVSERDLFEGIRQTLKKYIANNWSRKKHHVIQHSSGFDSRVMSTIIREIYEENGDSWLGDVTLVSWGYENDLARQIIVAEGWDAELHHQIVKDTEYFKTNLNFSDAWRKLNGVAGYPINSPFSGIDILQNRGIIPSNPDKVQVWAASWFNETFKAIMTNKPFERAFIEPYYNCVNAQYGAAYEFEFIQPMMNPETIRYLSSVKAPLPNNQIEARGHLVKHVCPKLSKFPRLDAAKVSIPTEVFEMTKRDYEASWYGSRNSVKFTQDSSKLLYNSWWAQWSKASFIEHLREEGVEIG